LSTKQDTAHQVRTTSTCDITAAAAAAACERQIDERLMLSSLCLSNSPLTLQTHFCHLVRSRYFTCNKMLFKQRQCYSIVCSIFTVMASFCSTSTTAVNYYVSRALPTVTIKISFCTCWTLLLRVPAVSAAPSARYYYVYQQYPLHQVHATITCTSSIRWCSGYCWYT